MDGEHEPGCGHDDDGDEAVDHGLLACSLVRLATVASAKILIANSYAPLPQRGEGEGVLHAPASRLEASRAT